MAKEQKPKREKPKIEPLDLSFNLTVELCEPVKDKLKGFKICGPHIVIKPCEPVKLLVKGPGSVPICVPRPLAAGTKPGPVPLCVPRPRKAEFTVVFDVTDT